MRFQVVDLFKDDSNTSCYASPVPKRFFLCELNALIKDLHKSTVPTATSRYGRLQIGTHVQKRWSSIRKERDG